MDLLKATVPILLTAALTGAASEPATSQAEIGVQDRANAYASIAASGQVAAVAWGATTKDGTTDIYVAASRDGGRTFGAPTRANHVAGQANLSGEQPPRVALMSRSGREPAIVVIWTAKDDHGARLLSARSGDGGRSFSPAVPVPGTDAPGNRGWASAAVMRDGSIAAVWLDHRALMAAAGTNHPEHQHVASGQNKADGVARAQLSQLFFARVGETGSSHAIARGVCYCCKTAMATDAAGVIYTAWRHVYEGNVRDIAFSKSNDGGRTFTSPVRVSDDNWVLDGCPENGPALAVDKRARVHAVWPTLVPGPASASQPTLALFYAMSTDGRHFTPRQQIPTEGVPRHPQIALGPQDEVVVVWDEQATGTRRIALARGTIDAAGTARFLRQPIDDTASAAYPIVATGDGGTIVAWTSGSTGQTGLRVKRLPN